MLRILLVEDEADLRQLLTELLRREGHRVEAAKDGAVGMHQLHRQIFDLVISDIRLPWVDGLTLFRTARKEVPATEVILMTGYGDVGQAVGTLKEGACDYLTKPFKSEELLERVRRIDNTRSLRAEREHRDSGRPAPGAETRLVGESPAIHRVLEMVKRVSQSDAPVLIVGESGTGKEIVARLIHEQSPRRDRPFLAVNCGALGENLIEAELFGHEEGAFTGATRKRDGRFKAADGGVLFLDEIAELPALAQAKLLRVLQEGAFEPLGSNQPIQVDVRIVSATHRSLPERIKAGLFREDLFYRVNGIEIQVPPLRERNIDVPLLVQHFLRQLVALGAPIPSVSPGAWSCLLRHDYPGNVRELSHAIRHALVLSAGREIDTGHLPPAVAGQKTSLSLGQPYDPPVIGPLYPALREFERQYVEQALAASSGHRAQAAARLGVSRKTLWEKLRAPARAAKPGDDDDLTPIK
jgi:DNA-binding NtrC family response regulator